MRAGQGDQAGGEQPLRQHHLGTEVGQDLVNTVYHQQPPADVAQHVGREAGEEGERNAQHQKPQDAGQRTALGQVLLPLGEF